MANVNGPKLELEIALNGIDAVNQKLETLSQKIRILNNVNVEITFDSKIEAVKKSINKTVRDIQQTIAKINENPLNFDMGDKTAFDDFKAGLGSVDAAIESLSAKAATLAESMKTITGSGRTLAIAAGTKSVDKEQVSATAAYAEATAKLNKELDKLREARPIELKFDPTNINAIIGTLEHAVTKLNLVRNALGTALDLAKVKIPVPKKNSIDVNDDYFKRMGESISNSINNSMGKLDIGKQLNTSLAQIDFKGMADGINAALNKVYEQDKINKIPVVPTIDDGTIKGLKARLTNLLKEIKESHGKIPLELTLDIGKLRERLKVARGELDRFKKTDRFKPPLTLNLNDFKEKIKAAKEALKKFRESDETKVNLKIVINDANKVLADFNTANSSLLTDKTINVTLAYSEFDEGIKHVKEALSSLKDMTIHINSNVKDVIAKEKVKEQELKEKAKAEKEKAEKEKKPAFESKENYQTMLDNLMKHPLSNGKTPEGNATLQSRLSSIKTLQSAIEHGKAHRDDPNAFLVGIKEEGFLRTQREWLENAMAAVGQNMTVSQAQKELKKQERLNTQQQREKTQQEYNNRTTALNVQERFQQANDRQNQNNRNNSVYDESIKQNSNQRKIESEAIRQQMVEADKLERKLKDIKSQYESSFRNTNPMTLKRYMQMGDVERNTIARLNELNGSGSNHTPVFGSEADYNLYATKFANSTLASQMANGRERAQTQRENEESKAQRQQERESAREKAQQDRQEVIEATRLTAEAEKQKKLQNDILRAEEKLKRIQQNYGFALYGDKPMSLKQYMKYDTREQEAIAELNRLHSQAGTTGNYSSVFSGLQGYSSYSNGYQVTTVENELAKLQQKLADSRLGERPMKEQRFMENSTKEQELIDKLNRLNGSKRDSVYNGSSGYQQYLDEMRMAGKITAEEEKRNKLVQRRKDIAHEYSQELQRQHQLLESGREVSQKELDASERRIENIRRKWDNADWGTNETKPELRQSHLHGRNAQEINQQNSVKNAMAWQSQYFSTANSKVGTLTASLEKLYTELKRNPGDSGLKGSIKETTRELARAQREANEVTKEMNKLNGTLSAGLGNKLKWISGAFGFYESYDILRDAAEVFSDINEGMANLRTVMPAIQHGEGEGQKRTKAEADAAMAAQARTMVSTAGDYGIGIDETIESARLWGRMYKDQNTVNLLTAQSAKLAVADNFSVEESTKAVEAAMFQFGMQAKTTAEALTYSNRIIDVYTKLSHNAGVSAQDLAAGVERSGAVAHQAGMSFEFLNALIAQGTRSTALSGLTNYSPFMLETA